MLSRTCHCCGQPEFHLAGEFWKKAENTPLRDLRLQSRKLAYLLIKLPFQPGWRAAFRDIHSRPLPVYLEHGPTKLMWPRKNTQNIQVFKAAASCLQRGGAPTAFAIPKSQAAMANLRLPKQGRAQQGTQLGAHHMATADQA